MPKLNIKKYRFFTRKNIYGSYSIYTPDGNWIYDCGPSRKQALKVLNQFLKEVRLYK